MIGFFLQGIAIGFPAAAQPGPFQAYLLSQTMKNGWRKTLLAAFAPLISDTPIIVLMMLVLTQTPDWFLQGVRLVGGLFILYLARGAYLTFREANFDQPTEEESGQQSLLQAGLMNLLNPNPYIFWGAVGVPILLNGWRQSPSIGAAFLIGFYCTMVTGSMGLIMLFGTAQQLGSKVTRILTGISVIALLAFGLFQIGAAVAPWLGLA